MLDLLPPLNGQKCLEVGCQTGVTSYFLRQRGGDWTSPAAQTTVTARRKQDDWAGRGWQNGWRWYDLGDTGRVVGFRVVSPVEPERDRRESYLKREPGED